MLWWLLILLVPYVYLLYVSSLKSSKVLPTFFGVKIVKRTFVEYLILAINAILFTLILLIIIDPKITMNKVDKGDNVVLVLDTSGSMIAKDIAPNRYLAELQYSKEFVKGLRSGDRVGVISFSTYPSVVSFLTPNKEEVVAKLDSMSKSPNGATALGSALAMGVDMVTSIPAEKNFIILLTDGVSNTGIPVSKALAFAEKKHVQVFTVALGRQTKTLIGYDAFGQPEYAGVDVDTLQKIAKKTHGLFFRATDEVDLRQIYNSLKKNIVKNKEKVSIRPQLITAFFIIYLLGLFIKLYEHIPY